MPTNYRTCHSFVIALSIILITLSVTGCSGSSMSAPEKVTLTVSAASDLIDAFQELGLAFEKETGEKVVFNFGSSGKLAQQIQQGAPVDVFASASVFYVDELERGGLIIPSSKTLYARGRITLWPRDDSLFYPQSIQDLVRPEVKLIAIANPEHAPYGKAALEAMQSVGIWETVKPKLIIGENVSQTFQYAKTRNVDVAIVALSLANRSGNTRWAMIPENLHQPINQAMGIVKSTPNEKAARQFTAFVNSYQGREIMRKYGFTLPGEELPG